MDFLSAVKALSEGRCEGIKRKHFDDTMLVTMHTINSAMSSVIDHNDILATDWKLVGEKPLTEDVEVTRWMCTECEEIYEHDPVIDWVCGAALNAKGDHCKNDKYIKLTGTYTRPVKRKVKRREDVTKLNSCPILPVDSKVIPGTLHLIAEWEEEE